MQAAETQYVECGDVYIAYQVVGDGPVDLLVAIGVPLSIDSLWDAPPAVRFLERLGSFARVILFDRRGIGLSDPTSAASPPTLEQWMEDALAILDEIGSDHVAVLGSDIHGGQVCALLSATHPERVSAAVIVNSAANLASARTETVRTGGLLSPPRDVNRTQWIGANFDIFAPSLASDGGLREWWRRAVARSASPSVARSLLEVRDNTDVRSVLPTIRVPTLVISRRDNRAYASDLSRDLAERIPSARYIELEGEDQLIFAGDQSTLLDEIQEFLTGARPAPEPDRVLSTVLFTDIVRSTETAAELGDRRWRDLIDRHDEVVDKQLERFGGRRVHSIGQGDGVLATFDGPARAVRCAQAFSEGVRALDIEVRCGVHTGEIELRSDDIGGIAVHIAARVKEHSGSSEVLVSRTVTDLVAGSGLEFEDRGEHKLKGVPGTWQLFAVRS